MLALFYFEVISFTAPHVVLQDVPSKSSTVNIVHVLIN